MNPREIQLFMMLLEFMASKFGIYNAGVAAATLRTVRFEVARGKPETVLWIVHPEYRDRREVVMRHKSEAVVVRYKERLLERIENTEKMAELMLFAPQYSKKLQAAATQ